MAATTEWYRQDPILTLTGGADFDFTVTITRVQSTTLDGRLGDVIRIGALDLTGWGSFRGELRSNDGLLSELVSVVVDGDADEGTIRVRGHRNATWRLQQAGVRAGRLTIDGQAPSGQRFTLVPARWSLRVGSTSPTAPTVPDYTVLR